MTGTSSTTYPYCDTVASSSYSRISFNGFVFSVVTGKENHPMVTVSWYGAAAYANWRSQENGMETCYNTNDFTPDLSKHGFRMPTEAEWEYAARGGLPSKRYPWGDAVAATQANFRTSGDPYEVDPYPSTPVGFYTGALQQKSSFNWPGSATSYQTTNGVNGYGLYDMVGNVWEWCNDWYSPTYYTGRPNPDINPSGPADGTFRVLRGGDWNDTATYCRTATRCYLMPGFRFVNHGFRLALDFSTIPDGMVWVSVSDPGVSGHEPFNGQMSKYETTNAQYCQFLNDAKATGDITVSGNDILGANGSNSGADFVGQVYYNLPGSGFTYNGSMFSVYSGFENYPVTLVTWYGATAFCNYYGFRLPTEWEWQAVADYDGSHTYGCGMSINNSIANYAGSTHPDGTTLVGAFGTYGYGMCDMAGNVWEWTSSVYGPYLIFRGGSWYNPDYACTVSYRGYHWAYDPSSLLGFRVCR